jgi:hypothetical protein
MKNRRWVSAQAAVVLSLGTFFLGSVASADCANSGDYHVVVDANKVTVGPLDPGSARRCGVGLELLRQNLADGAVVNVGNTCIDQGQHLDECVPPGKYRYGYATPFDCSESGCGSVALYIGVTVSAKLTTDCIRGSTAPAAVATKVPWSDGDPAVTRFKKCSDGGCGVRSSSRSAVRLFDLLAFGAGVYLIALRSRTSRRRRNSCDS